MVIKATSIYVNTWQKACINASQQICNLLKLGREGGSSLAFTSFSMQKRCLNDSLQYCAASKQLVFFPSRCAKLPRHISSWRSLTTASTLLAQASFNHHLHYHRIWSAYNKGWEHKAPSGTGCRYRRRERSGCFCEAFGWTQLQQEGWR